MKHNALFADECIHFIELPCVNSTFFVYSTKIFMHNLFGEEVADSKSLVVVDHFVRL
jgi:hypothetical protein